MLPFHSRRTPRTGPPSKPMWGSYSLLDLLPREVDLGDTIKSLGPGSR